MTERERKEAYDWVADAITTNWPGIDLPGWPPPDAAKRGTLLEVKRIRDAMRAASEVPLSPSGEAEEEMTLAEVEAVDRRYQELIASGRLSEQKLQEAFDRRFPPKAGSGPLGPTQPLLLGDVGDLVSALQRVLKAETDFEEAVGAAAWRTVELDDMEPEAEEVVRALRHADELLGRLGFLAAFRNEAKDGVRPEASRLEQEEAGRGSPPPPEEGQGPAVEEGPPPASVSLTDVTAADSICDEVASWANAGFREPGGLWTESEVQSYRDHLHDCEACVRVVQLRIAEEEARRS